MKRRLLSCSTYLLLAGAGLGAPPAQAAWKAGAASVDITPTESIWMAGYAARTRPSEGVRQKLFVKALALEEEGGAVSVLVTSDLLGFTREMAEQISAEAARRYRIPRERLILNASHTHSGPVTGQLLRPAYVLDDPQQAVVRRYTEWLLGRVVEAIGQAVEHRGPVVIEHGQGFAGFAVNRRRVGHREYPGPVDHDVPVLRVAAPDGALRALVFGYSCHATVLSDYQINGDWPGYAQAALEERFPGTTALFLNGAGADQNPLPRREVWLAETYGKVIAEAVAQVLDAKMKTLDGPLAAAFETVDLPLRPWSKAEFERRLNEGNQYEKLHAQMMLERLSKEGSLPASYPYPVQVWRFGQSLRLVALGGELVVDYSLRFRRQYGWEDTWISGYNNDVFAYIPSLRVLREGGYEGGGAMIPYGQPGPFGPAVEELIAEKVDQLIHQVEH